MLRVSLENTMRTQDVQMLVGVTAFHFEIAARSCILTYINMFSLKHTALWMMSNCHPSVAACTDTLQCGFFHLGLELGRAKNSLYLLKSKHSASKHANYSLASSEQICIFFNPEKKRKSMRTVWVGNHSDDTTPGVLSTAGGGITIQAAS